jgi:nucleoside-diphosphate-sugar epimerase
VHISFPRYFKGKLIMKVLVTGANGFIGSALILRLLKESIVVRGAVRKKTLPVPAYIDSWAVIDDYLNPSAWPEVLQGVDAVIHTAALAHVVRAHDSSLEEFRKVNAEATMQLAQAAVLAGVKRFIFLSTIKVNGEGGLSNKPYTADDNPAPADSYAISKYEAEQGLLSLAKKTKMDVVIIRSVLVYGPGVKANFKSMLSWLSKGIPLPFGAIRNKRSLVALDNFVDLVVSCLTHPAAVNQVFLVSDGEDLSTPELLRQLGEGLDRPVRLIPVPSFLLNLFARLFGKEEIARRLCGSLQVDISKNRTLLNWTPPVSASEALRKTARDYIESH